MTPSRALHSASKRKREVGGLLEHAVVVLQVFLVPLMSSSHVDRVIELLSVSMEPMEVVAGGEQPVFIDMKRKSGGQLDLVCEVWWETEHEMGLVRSRTRGVNLTELALRLRSARDMESDLGDERNKLGDTTGGRAGRGVCSRRSPTRRLCARSSRKLTGVFPSFFRTRVA